MGNRFTHLMYSAAKGFVDFVFDLVIGIFL
jgi:hypothetical protein